jgi:hypothetical protein
MPTYYYIKDLKNKSRTEISYNSYTRVARGGVTLVLGGAPRPGVSLQKKKKKILKKKIIK